MNDYIAIGERIELRQRVPFGLSPADRRQHLWIVGKSGTGKSTLLRNLILQDIYAGRGCALIDPHGDLAEEILAHVPSWRADDMVYFDPSDRRRAVAFNPLFNVPHGTRHLVVSGIVAAFRDLFPSSWGPRMEYIFSAAIAAVIECQNVSLLSVHRMLSDKRYRAWIVKQVKDPIVRAFWVDEFERYDPPFMREAVAPIQNKLGQILMSPHLRGILGQVKSRINARFMMDNGRIFIANLSKGKLGADKANLIGALLVSQFQVAAMSRADVPEDERRDFHLFVDEFHSFGSESFATLLSEARKYRLNLTLAHQFLDQVNPKILSALVGNVGSVVAFRVGHADAERLEKAIGGSFRAEDFASLNNHELYAKLLAHGKDAAPFHAHALPPLGKRHERSAQIVRRSRQRYGRKRADTERKIARWMSST